MEKPFKTRDGKEEFIKKSAPLLRQIMDEFLAMSDKEYESQDSLIRIAKDIKPLADSIKEKEQK